MPSELGPRGGQGDKHRHKDRSAGGCQYFAEATAAAMNGPHKTRKKYTLPAEGMAQVEVEVCRAFFLHVHGFGSNGELVDKLLSRESDMLVPEMESLRKHGGGKTIDATKVAAVEATLASKERTAGHYVASTANQSARYFVEEDITHRSLWLDTMARTEPDFVAQAKKYNFYFSHDEKNKIPLPPLLKRTEAELTGAPGEELLVRPSIPYDMHRRIANRYEWVRKPPEVDTCEKCGELLDEIKLAERKSDAAAVASLKKKLFDHQIAGNRPYRVRLHEMRQVDSVRPMFDAARRAGETWLEDLLGPVQPRARCERSGVPVVAVGERRRWLWHRWDRGQRS